jgi:TolB-like protein
LIEPADDKAPNMWDGLRSRKVVQWGLGYVAVAWGLLQGTEFAVTTFHWPEALTRMAAVAAVAGLPVTLTIAWFHGKRGGQRVRRLEVVVVAVLVVAGMVAVYREANEVPAPTVAANAKTPGAGPPGVTAEVPARSVAVLPFESIGEAKDGAVLAFGIAEAVLHQLANLRELEVTARTSSFSLQDKPGDARTVGRALNVRYLLEGSVQGAGDRLRITAQLIDTATGAHVWSIRFDKERADIFAVQDEIAAQVARALQLSLDADATDRLAGQGTTNVNAYLAYLQGRSLLAKASISEVGHAIEQFTLALQLDPSFPAAYVSLAEAEIFAAEFDATDDRAARFEKAGLRATELVTKALTLDPDFGPAYVMRGYLEAFSDLEAAEADYRRGLELRPSDAKGYAGLAAVLFEQLAKREEALRMLEHARRLDPLEPAHDVAKAVLLFYDRGDVKGAEALLRNVLQRKPDYLPAMVRLAEMSWAPIGNTSEAIKYFEQAIRLDPLSHWARRVLVRAYLDVQDERAAEAVINEEAAPSSVLELPLAIYRKQWQRAGELAYLALDRQLVAPTDEALVVAAIRRHARVTGEYQRAIDAIEVWSGVTWAAQGMPRVPQGQGLKTSAIGLGDLLLASGDRERGQPLLRTVIEQLNSEVRSGMRAEIWAFENMSVALALSGDKQRELDSLQRTFDAGVRGHGVWEFLEADPAFDGLRGEPRFVSLTQKVNRQMAAERAKIEKLRASGEIPER